MPGVDFQLVRQHISMKQVIDLLNYQPDQRTGNQLRGPCPIHRSTYPRSRIFSVDLAGGRFQCFKCGAKGNHLDLWAQIHGTTVHAAAIDLCQRLGIDVPWINRW